MTKSPRNVIGRCAELRDCPRLQIVFRGMPDEFCNVLLRRAKLSKKLRRETCGSAQNAKRISRMTLATCAFFKTCATWHAVAFPGVPRAPFQSKSVAPWEGRHRKLRCGFAKCVKRFPNASPHAYLFACTVSHIRRVAYDCFLWTSAL